MQVQQTIPILRIFDVAKAKEFYCDYLGFELEWEHRFEPGMPVYMQVTRGGMTLHLSEHHGDACPGARVFAWVTGIKAFHEQISGKDYPYMNPGLDEAFYGALCVNVTDPFGNRLTFNERLETAEAG